MQLLSQTKVSRVFPDKTVPTSMVVSMLAWGLSTPRVSSDLFQRCFEMLSDMIDLCTSGNDNGGLELTVVPEMGAWG